MIHETTENARYLQGNAGSHQDVRNSGKHRTVQGGQVGNLDLFQVVDSHASGMPFASEEDLDKVRRDAQLLEFARAALRLHRQCFIWATRPSTSRNEIRLPDPFGHPGKGKVIEAAAHMTVRVAVLQSSGEDLIERRSGYNAQLAECRDSPRQPPIGNAGPHAALNNLGMSALKCAHLLFAIGFRYL